MTDIKILEALLMGWHLNKEELERAKQLVHTFNIHLKQHKP